MLCWSYPMLLPSGPPDESTFDVVKRELAGAAAVTLAVDHLPSLGTLPRGTW
jgi:hypothetical protein